MKLWLNGGLQEEDQARIAPADRGLLLGDGVFETMAARAGEVPALARHYARLCRGASLLRLPVALSQDDLAGIVREVLASNGLSDAALRLTLTRGTGPRGLWPGEACSPTLLLTASAMPAPAPPARVMICSIRRDETSPLSTIKSLNYLPNVLARLEAAEQGADDALLLNQAGRVAEASAASLFVCLGGTWFTPAVSEGALPGVRRAMLLESGHIKEALLNPADLIKAQALCLGNALSLRPVAALGTYSYPDIAVPQGSLV